MKKRVSTRLFSGVLCLIIFIVSISALVFNENHTTISLVLIPLIYGFLYIAIIGIYRYYMYPGMFMLNVISFMRYVVIPILILLNKEYYDVSGMLNKGIALMIYEEISVGLLLLYLVSKRYKKSDMLKNFQINNYISTKVGLIFKIIVFISIVVISINPSSLNKFNFFLKASNESIYLYGQAASGFNSIILDWAKLVLPLLLVSNLIKRYKSKPSSSYYYLTVIIILFFNLMIFSGISRNSAVLPGIASLFFIVKVFPKRKKQTFMIVSTATIFVVVFLTAFKNNYLGVNENYTFSSLINYLENYFVGPKQLGFAIKAKEMLGSTFTFNTFLNDIFGNAPGLSSFFDLENRSTTFFNLAVYDWGAARDAIIPTIGEGLFYFGYIFSVVTELIIISIMSKLDMLYLKSDNIMSMFFMAYFAVRFGNNFVQNVTILSGFAFTTLLPMMVLMYINEKQRNDNKKTKEEMI